jgi:hypothetical protein
MFYVEYSKEDKEYIGLCDKYPYLSYLHKRKFIAYFGIVWLSIVVYIDTLKTNSED